MTNRTRFNRYLRDKIARQIEYYEAMSNDEIVNIAYNNPNTQIRFKLGDELIFFKTPIRSKEDLIEWLGDESV